MSGGHFNYNQHYMEYIAEDIEKKIRDNKIKNEWISDEEWERMGRRYYSNETIKEFRKGIKALKKAYVYAQRIDWLISGDDGEETFHKRLKEELRELK